MIPLENRNKKLRTQEGREVFNKDFQKEEELPRLLSGKDLPAEAGGAGSTPGLGRSPGEGNGNPLQYSCLKNLMDREAWWTTVHGVAKSQTRLSD